ncbi:MAG: tetratricopeptide repeat protein [Desulfosarcinaceae bacterium]|nr:tetratricopeptide repeat protein [Desulfosarcinaceae bacterium]
MSDDPEIYTLTMARVYAQQGHHDRAAAIYRHLLLASPHDETLIKALADAEAALVTQRQTQRGELVQLTREWIRLLQLRERLNRLRKLLS